MPNIKSAVKRMRTAERSRDRNRDVKSKLRTLRRKLDEQIEAGDRGLSAESYRAYASALDKAAKKGVIQRNTADRNKSRTLKRVVALA